MIVRAILLNTNELQEMVMSTITLLNTIVTDETANRLGICNTHYVF